MLPLVIAGIALAGITAHLVLRALPDRAPAADAVPLLAVLVVGGIPLVAGLIVKLVRGEVGADLLAGISIVTAALLGERRAGVCNAHAPCFEISTNCRSQRGVRSSS